MLFQCEEKNLLSILPIFYKVEPSDYKYIARAVMKRKEHFQKEMEKLESWKLIFKKEIEKVESWELVKVIMEEKGLWECFKKEMMSVKLWERLNEEMANDKLCKTVITKVQKMRGDKIDMKTDEPEFIKKFVDEVSKAVPKTVPFYIKYPVGLKSHVDRIREKLSLGLKETLFLGIVGSSGVGKTTIAKAVCNEIYQSFEGNCSFLSMVEEKPNLSREMKSLVALQNQLVLDVSKTDVQIKDVNNGTQTIKEHLEDKKVLIVVDNVECITQLQYLVGADNWFGERSRIIITTTKEDLLTGWVEKEKIYRVKEMDEEDSFQLLSLHVFKQNHPPENFVSLVNEVVRYAQHLPLAIVVLSPLLLGKTEKEGKILLQKWKMTPHQDIMTVLETSFKGLDNDGVDRAIFLHISCFFVGDDVDEVIDILNACDLCEGSTKTRIELLIERSLLEINENRLCMHDMIRDMGRAIVRRESLKPGERSRLWGKDAINVWKKCTGTDKVEAFEVNLSLDKEFQWTTEVLFKMHDLRILRIYSPNVALKHRHDDDWNLNFNCLAYICWMGFPFECIPSNFRIENLAILELFVCPNLKQVWKGTNKHFPKLKVINLWESPIKCLSDFSFLPNLEKLTVGNCDKLVKVDESIGDLSKLVELDLSNCTSLTDLPSSMCQLSTLPMLSSSLYCFQAVRCQSLKRLAPLSNLKHLRTLDLSWCTKLNKIEGLEGLELVEVMKLLCCLSLKKLAPLSNLKHLRTLDLSWCKNLQEIEGLEGLESVEVILLTNCHSLEKLAPNLSNLKHLRMLDLLGCSKLNKIEGLEDLESAETINLIGCNKLTSFADKSMLQMISKDFGNQNICDIYSSDTKISKSVILMSKNFVTRLHFATWEIGEVPNMEIQGVIIHIVYVPISSNFQRIPTLRVVVDNQSKRIPWERKGEKLCGPEKYLEYDPNFGVFIWVIKIPYCVWKSIANCGDIISISVQNDPGCYGIQTGVHFDTLQEKGLDHLQVPDAEQFYQVPPSPERESGAMNHESLT
ncbi:hypothetical protein NE237_021123 [Protea cynaroides]|uniref:AAA+ ATPase domain-containing protein n=1 Tax=Protea cynaroides TaxID=273540 RepID=A0A9Q0H7Y1_9MAGN|nr:hypothetical protein NE237_021123 [Protea cynaroides]